MHLINNRIGKRSVDRLVKLPIIFVLQQDCPSEAVRGAMFSTSPLHGTMIGNGVGVGEQDIMIETMRSSFRTGHSVSIADTGVKSGDEGVPHIAGAVVSIFQRKGGNLLTG